MVQSVARFATGLVLIISLLACQQEPTPPTAGIVEANRAYLNAFGDPPKVKTGKAYAVVGYLPLKNSPGVVGAVPLYIYDEHEQLSKILARLVSDDLTLPPKGSLYKPFPKETQVQLVSRTDKDLVLSLAFEPETSVDPMPMVIAVAETALQFEDVGRVEILVNGDPVTGLPTGGLVHDEKRIAKVGPPDLVMIAGIWDEGATDPDEIMVNFDRPVIVNSFNLTHADGRKVAGEYFTSVFQMSIIVHPEEAGMFRGGENLGVTWEVVDALGRVGRGEQVLPLERFVHEPHLKEFQKK